MKCIFHILFFLISISCLAQNNLLEKKVTLPVQEARRYEILNIVSNQLSITFSYSSVIKPDEIISLSQKKYVLKDLLDEMFFNITIEYVVSVNNILLKPVSKTDKKEESVKKIIITGEVLNHKNKPLSSVNIYLINKSIGTITNDEGKFKLVVPPKYSNDTLVISILGYKKIKLPLAQHHKNNYIINLKKENYSIQGIVVKPEDPIDIIVKARSRINENYSDSSVLLTGFFRESTKQDMKYVALTEALLTIYKTPYKSVKEDLIKLDKARKGINVEKSEIVNLIVQGSLYNHLQLDIVKYGVTFLDPDFFSFYTYSLEDKIYLDDRPTYIIYFDQKDGIKYPCYKGRLFIDMESFAIVKCEFGLSPKGVSYANKIYIKKNPSAYNVKIQHAQYKVNYRYYDNIWNLTGTQGEFAIKLRERKRKGKQGIKAIFTTSSELIITEKTGDSVEKIKRNEAFSSTDILIDQIAGTDSEYWGNNNVILPEEPLLETINKFRKLQEEKSQDNTIQEESSSKVYKNEKD